MQLTGATIVVTGASSGIGRETALRLASRGANVVIAARREEPLRTLEAQCRAEGADVLAMPVDVADEAAVKGLAQAAIGRFGRIDGWVNNASVSLVGPFESLPPDAFRRTLDINFFGVVNGSRAALQSFRRTGEGVIVNVASLAGRVGAPYYTAYAAAKHAVVGFSQSLRMELAKTPRIKVCTVMPAAIDTPFFEHSGNYAGRPFKPIRPFYQPELVADMIVGLLERPRGEVFAGDVARGSTWFRTMTPALFERAYGAMVERDHFLPEPEAAKPGNVFEPMGGTDVHGGWAERQPSFETASRVGALASVAAIGALLVALGSQLRGRR
jgi:NAD(P)-dependent dehydrogenase (short-subunit alcohol dehydrogenase family)